MTIATRYARHTGIAALFVAAALLGTLAGVLFAYSDDLPEVSALDNYSPNTITRVLGKDNQLVGEFAVERRVVIHYDDIPENLRQAILAAEDGDFFQHAGLSISRMMLALVRDVVSSGRVPGGSTLTQQLARNLFATNIGFTTGDRSWERKIKESLVAVQIEKRYTKPEIFTMYCNQIYFGHGAYGVEAASQLYFRKPAKELALEEAATIAGIIQGNVRQSPFVNPEATRRRRNYALDRMAVEGFITDAVATETKEKPIVVAGDPAAETSQAPTSLKKSASTWRPAMARRRCMKAASRCARLSTCVCSRPPTVPSTRDCAVSTSGAGSANRAATSWPKAARLTTSNTTAGPGAWPRATSCPR